MENKIYTISDIPDELLLKILSLLPSIKDVVATSVLSRRWQSLVREVRTLKCDGRSLLRCYKKFMVWIRNRPNVETLELRLDPDIRAFPIVKHFFSYPFGSSLRELRIEMLYNSLEFPLYFYLSSRVETLVLEKLHLVDVPSFVSLARLKRLHLLSVMFQADQSVESLLSICPRLEDLVVRRSTYTNVKIFTIDVPTLKTLSIYNTSGKSRPQGAHGFVIIAPSLTSFSIRDSFSNYLEFENMPVLVKASVNVVYDQPDRFLGSLASTKYLSLCYGTSQTPYSSMGTSFLFLEHLELCTCSVEWWNLLTSILDDAPRLRVLQLRLFHNHHVQCNDVMDRFHRPSSVPECLSLLEIFEWRQYKGAKQEKEVATYILENANHLKKATFYLESAEKHGMLNDLQCVVGGSKTCEFLYG